jgi:hypothetical protein
MQTDAAKLVLSTAASQAPRSCLRKVLGPMQTTLPIERARLSQPSIQQNKQIRNLRSSRPERTSRTLQVSRADLLRRRCSLRAEVPKSTRGGHLLFDPFVRAGELVFQREWAISSPYRPQGTVLALSARCSPLSRATKRRCTHPPELLTPTKSRKQPPATFADRSRVVRRAPSQDGRHQRPRRPYEPSRHFWLAGSQVVPKRFRC